MGSIELMNENLIAVPESIIEMSEWISAVISLVVDLAERSNAEMKQISEGVADLRATIKGKSRSLADNLYTSIAHYNVRR